MNYNCAMADKYYNDKYIPISDEEIKELEQTYNIINVPFLHEHQIIYGIDKNYYRNLVRYEADEKEESIKYIKAQKITYSLLDVISKNGGRELYNKLDYICNEKEKVCICNENANLFRKIYDPPFYYSLDKNKKFINWIELPDQ